MNRMIRSALTLCALWLTTLLTGACTPSLVAAEMHQLAAPAQRQLAAQLQPGNRLVVQAIDGNIYTIDPDGGRVLWLTTDATLTRQYVQPTWSPDAAQLAWSKVEIANNTTQSALQVSSANGVDLASYDTPFAPFYLYWSPDGKRLAYLSNWITRSLPSIALRVVNLIEAGAARTVAEGQPLYFDWSPDGTRLLSHLSNTQIAIESLDGAQQTLAGSLALFPAPEWAAGDRLVYAILDETGQSLVLATPEGQVIRQLTDFQERITFSVNGAGEQIAYTITPSGLATAAFGPLYATELESGRTRQLSEAPVIAFFWSPDSSKLAYLAAVRTNDSIRLAWHVWDGKQDRSYDSILPSRVYLESYLAFFDQYARSTTIWAPDSSAFAYAGADESGRSGVWVQPVTEGSSVRWLGLGVNVSWSPR